MSAQRLIVLTVSLILSLACLPAVASEHDHHAQDSDAPGEPAAHMAAPDDYSAAVRSLDPHLDRVAELIQSGQLDDLHKAAEPIKTIAKTLAKLAFKDDSGVPKDDVREINLTAKALAETWEKIDEAGDSGNLGAAKKVYQEMVGLTNMLRAYARIDDYATALMAIHRHLAYVAMLIESGQLDDLHKAAEPIKTIAKTLAKLAFKDDSGVPKDDVREINLTAKALAETWEKIDEAGDSGDLDAAKKVYQEMVDLTHTLKQYAPADDDVSHEHAETDEHDDQDNHAEHADNERHH